MGAVSGNFGCRPENKHKTITPWAAKSTWCPLQTPLNSSQKTFVKNHDVTKNQLIYEADNLGTKGERGDLQRGEGFTNGGYMKLV